MCFSKDCLSFFKESAPARQCYYCDSSSSSGSGDVTAPTSCTATTICQSDSVIYVLLTRLLVFFLKEVLQLGSVTTVIPAAQVAPVT